MDDAVDWVAEPVRISGPAAIGPRDTPASWRVETAHLLRASPGMPHRFGPSAQVGFAHGQQRTAQSLVATLATRAGLLVLPEDERQAALERIHEFLLSRPETARGEFTLPMQTCALRAHRL